MDNIANEIIKALEWLEEIKGVCPSDINYINATNIQGIINCFQKEIKRLKKENKSQKAEIEELKFRSEGAEIDLRAIKDEMSDVITMKVSEAIKEFAERLKGKATTPIGTLYGEMIHIDDIANLAKEMTEEKHE